jgi:hypothetical protein
MLVGFAVLAAEEFSRIRKHALQHIRYICQIPQCLQSIQGKGMTKQRVYGHYRDQHVQRGHCADGECKPSIMVSN